MHLSSLCLGYEAACQSQLQMKISLSHFLFLILLSLQKISVIGLIEVNAAVIITTIINENQEKQRLLSSNLLSHFKISFFFVEIPSLEYSCFCSCLHLDYQFEIQHNATHRVSYSFFECLKVLKDLPKVVDLCLAY